MKTRTTTVIPFIIIAACFVAGAIVYPQLPAQIASHWDVNGAVNGHMSKFTGVFLLPVVMLLLAVFALVLPHLDPLKGIFRFRPAYDVFWILLELFLAYLYALTLAWNLGTHYDIGQALMPAFAILWYGMGVLLKKVKRNWFVGIRTPWTLSSDLVWDKTHALGSILFKVAAIFALIGVFFPHAFFWWLIAPLLIVVIVTVVYSYVLFREEERG